MKSGYKTTEFWVTIATIAGTALAAVAGGLPAGQGAAVTGGLAVAYGVFRAIVKVADAFASGSGTK